jgi:uncharacterized protein with von Willebrand factor type A (vWA) domain
MSSAATEPAGSRALAALGARGLFALVGFGRELRARGLPVGTGRLLAFCRAAGALAPLDRSRLYWAGHATLISNHRDVEAFDAAFDAWFGRAGADAGIDRLRDAFGAELAEQAADVLARELPLLVTPQEESGEEGGAETDEIQIGMVASDAEVLHLRAFELLTPAERRQATELIKRLRFDLPERPARRRRPSRTGRTMDLRRTLRRSLRTSGEPIERAWRERRTKARPLVLVLDVSGSMSSYSRALLQFGHAAMTAGRKVEVFVFGTRLTRITRALRGRDPDAALGEVSGVVMDWDGGTRIGSSIKELLDRYSQHASLRGSVVVLCSDGLDRGDPELLATQMARLGRLAYRVVWVNPLKGSPRYQPLARGMAAAMPHIDVFVPGHNVASLEALGGILGQRGL